MRTETMPFVFVIYLFIYLYIYALKHDFMVIASSSALEIPSFAMQEIFGLLRTMPGACSCRFTFDMTEIKHYQNTF